MPTLEVQLIKAEKNLAALEEVMKSDRRWFYRTPRADQLHGHYAELRGLSERVRYLQQRIEIRDAHAARTLLQLANRWIETYESVTLPTC
jgi:hypothetical protein